MLTLAQCWPNALSTTAEEVAIYWWHDESGCQQLSDNSVMGLRTAVRIAGLQPVLYGYGQPPMNLPSGVEYKDANSILPIAEFTEHRKSYAHAVVADLARLRGMKAALDAGATYVWFVDLDTLWCKDVKTACSQLPAAAFEHVIATMQGKRVCRAGIRKSIQKGMLEFLRVPFDYLYPGTPFRVTCRSPLLNALLAEMEAVVATRRRAHDYMVFMHLLGDKVEECGLLGAYQNPAAFSGVPYFTHRSCLVKSEIQVPYKGHKTTVTARDIMKDAIGVNT